MFRSSARSTVPRMRSAEPVGVSAVILAAGGSTRLGQPKQLLRLKGSDETLLERAARLAEEAGAGPIFVVLGADAEAIQRAVDLSNCVVLLNPEWREGMASSLRVGIGAVMEQAPAASGALLMVCDQPALTAEHICKLLASHQSEPEILAASRYAGRAGVPVVTPRVVFPALLTLTGDQGAQAIFGRSGLRIKEIEFAGGEWDIDTEEDLRRIEQP